MWLLAYAIDNKYEDPINRLFWVIVYSVYFILILLNRFNRAKITLLFATIFVCIQIVILISPKIHKLIYNLF
jgi:hypothetical protein